MIYKNKKLIINEINYAIKSSFPVRLRSNKVFSRTFVLMENIEFSIENVEELIKKAKNYLKNIDALSGDCGNFAMALGDFIDPKNSNIYACSYADFLYLEDGEPAHCGLIWKDYFWDINGKKEKKRVRQYLWDIAFDEAFPEYQDRIVVDYPIDLGENNILAFKGIYDKKKVDIIKEIFKKIINNNKCALVGYHATSKENAKKILDEGFKIQLSDEMFFGKGLYLSKNIEDAIVYKKRWEKSGRKGVILEVRLPENIDWCLVNQIEGLGTLEQYIRMKKKDSLSWYENQIEDRIVNNNLSNFPKVIFKYYELNGEPFYDSEDIHDDSMIFYEDIIDYVRNKHYREEDFYEGDIIERISQYYWYYLNEINISDTNYNYFSYDQERVEEFTKKMKESSYKYPPIVFDPINKMIIDGVHRVVVLKELGVEKVKSYIGDINAINEEFGTIMDLEELIKLKSTKEKKEDFYRFFTGFGKFELDETLLDEYFTQEYYDIAEDYGGCDVEIAPTQIIIHNEEILKRLEIKII